MFLYTLVWSVLLLVGVVITVYATIGLFGLMLLPVAKWIPDPKTNALLPVYYLLGCAMFAAFGYAIVFLSSL